MPFSVESALSGIAQAIVEIFSLTWWIIIPIVLLFIFLEVWLIYIRGYYFNNIKWVLLRIKTPKETLQSPKAMEQIFAAVNVTYSFGIRPEDKWLKGMVENWISFELVGDADGINFFIRIREDYRNALESAIYAQYPNAEIEAVQDYTDFLPLILPNDNLDIFGTDFVLARDDGYPIRTYPYFEAKEPEEKIDTISIITEAMSRLKEGERIWLQLLIRPINDAWKKKAEKLKDELFGRKAVGKPGLAAQLLNFFIALIEAPFKVPKWTDQEKPEKPMFSLLTKGEQDIVKGIEEKISKIGFESVIRFIYIDDRAKFSRDNISAVFGAFQQFNTLNMNGLKPNLDVMTITRGLYKNVFKKRRIHYRKRRVYESYRMRLFPAKFSVLNTEELATLYHFPTIIVEAPMLRPVEFKKSAPPTNLPI